MPSPTVKTTCLYQYCSNMCSHCQLQREHTSSIRGRSVLPLLGPWTIVWTIAKRPMQFWHWLELLEILLLPPPGRAIIRHEVFHTVNYSRAGNTCSNLILLQDDHMLMYGRLKKFVLVDTRPIAILQRLHSHNKNVCKDGKPMPLKPFLMQLVMDGTLASSCIAIEELDELIATECKFITRKCIFVLCKDFWIVLFCKNCLLK